MKAALDFLKKLSKHNNKEWFDAHKDEYLNAKAIYEAYVDGLIKGISKFDKAIDPAMTGKQCAFRIYKDVRFSKDKTPYKNNMGASISPGGKKSPEAGYYFHLQPGGCFIAGGVWMPEPEMLNAIRQEIDYHPKDLLRILNAPGFKKYFKGLDDDGKMVNPPKGYDKTHPQIEILKNRHFIVSHFFSDKQILAKDSQKAVIAGFKAMYPLMEFLRRSSD
jgi:uncharacterized protein (TIGR02453 family)